MITVELPFESKEEVSIACKGISGVGEPGECSRVLTERRMLTRGLWWMSDPVDEAIVSSCTMRSVPKEILFRLWVGLISMMERGEVFAAMRSGLI